LIIWFFASPAAGIAAKKHQKVAEFLRLLLIGALFIITTKQLAAGIAAAPMQHQLECPLP
jgi:hypothetical protein